MSLVSRGRTIYYCIGKVERIDKCISWVAVELCRNKMDVLRRISGFNQKHNLVEVSLLHKLVLFMNRCKLLLFLFPITYFCRYSYCYYSCYYFLLLILLLHTIDINEKIHLLSLSTICYQKQHIHTQLHNKQKIIFFISNIRLMNKNLL